MRHRKVLSVMTPAAAVVSVGVGADYKEIARLLVEHRVATLPVVDGRQRVVGVVSEADLLQKEAHMEPAAPAPSPRRGEPAGAAKAAGTSALDLMTSPAVTVGPDDDIVRAARLLTERGLRQLPVVDADGRLVGVVSRRDIVAVFVRPDADIRIELIDDVIARALHEEPVSLTVEVAEGVVTLRGLVATRSLAGLLGALARRLDGVVAVENELEYDSDDRGNRDDSDDRGAKPSRGLIHGLFHRRHAE